MKKILFPVAAILFSAGSLMAGDAVPAFPGAEGHGRYTSGGRGGRIIHVTNLNDKGAGSLRAAIEAGGKRTIVFDVAGTIHLNSNLVLKNGNVTILGQTAPGGGITVADYTFRVADDADNVVVRFMRFRRGMAKDHNEDGDASWGRHCHNLIFDHCSFSWSIDEVASYYDNENFTMQWCTIAEGLNNAGHNKGAHGYGGIWGGKGASFHHNLIAHNNNRNPRLNGARYNWLEYKDPKRAGMSTVEAEEVDLRNCVMYNWGTGNGAYGGPLGNHNIVNNYYKSGPATKNKTRVFQCSKNNSKDSKGVLEDGAFGKFFVDGNYMDSPSVTEDKRAYYDWSGVIYDKGGSRELVELDGPCDFAEVTTHAAEDAFEKVLEYAGASFYRDDVDARYAEEARTGTATFTGSISKLPGILDVNDDFGGFPELPAGTPIVDTDKDGMPDEWEIANGLNPNDPADASTVSLDTKGWYTNIEVYANELVEGIMRAGNKNAISSVDEYYPVIATTGITDITAGGEVDHVEYYDLRGIRLSEPAEGINIRRTVYTSGKTVTDKVIR